MSTKGPLLVAFDSSKQAAEALRHAVSLARHLAEELVILHVQPQLVTMQTSRFYSAETLHNYQQELGEEVLKLAKQQLAELEYTAACEVRIGNARDIICETALELRARYIVIGARSGGFVRGVLLGSVCHGVLNQAETPVIVVSANGV